MNLTEYKKRIMDTRVYPTQTDNFGRAYVTFGLIGEAFELAETINNFLDKDSETTDVDVVKELGDAWWYAGMGAFEYGIDLEYKPLPFQGNFDASMLVFLGNVVKLAEPCKKFYRDGKNKVEPFGHFLESLYDITDGLCSILDITPEDVWQQNINKLSLRKQKGLLQGEGSNREQEGAN